MSLELGRPASFPCEVEGGRGPEKLRKERGQSRSAKPPPPPKNLRTWLEVVEGVGFGPQWATHLGLSDLAQSVTCLRAIQTLQVVRVPKWGHVGGHIINDPATTEESIPGGSPLALGLGRPLRSGNPHTSTLAVQLDTIRITGSSRLAGSSSGHT